MQVNCWHEVGFPNGSKDVVKLRRLSGSQATELRAAIRAARAGDEPGDRVLFDLERGLTDGVRAVARVVVGVGVVVVMFAAVVGFLAPGIAGAALMAGVVAVVLVGLAALLGYEVDTGLRIRGDGTMRREGWAGISERNLRDYARVTLAERRHSDPGDGPIG